jgi:hypothetical protein
VKELSDVIFEFVVADGQVKAMKPISPEGEFTFLRR